MDELDVEAAPVDSQKERLESFVTELMLITRKYRILLNDRGETVEILDMDSGTLIGLGLAVFTAPDDDHRVICYVPADSILDGVWPVEGPDGPVEQRHVQNVFPLRDPPS
jgi:hypothetical protein